ncbi:glycosyl hydrolase family 28-related protein [Fischerella sp. PCC 9605]|uniref:glycosyl hydrolase family 28-related protein n=1 Tax=Fischerella sp. PCC 9605 TaxID=1173024 RepID=UPI0018CC6AA9|nr:glycosyl hydrolase family 28-related protein [Fischerella sp. PCC 9605]
MKPAVKVNLPTVAFDVIYSNADEGISNIELAVNLNAVTQQNDKQTMFDVVKDFHAKADGITDDTKAIQAAVDNVYQQGGGTIVFPPGTYVLTSVNIRENITYQGYGATIKRPPRQGKWTRTFTTENNLYGGETDSKPLIIKGFTFDGNSKNQGAYKNYELEQAHFIFLMGNPKFPGKLQAIIEDCTFKNGVADGISVYTNVDVKVANCEAIDVFRGGFVLTGGYSSAEVYNLTTRGKIDNTGLDIEVDSKGYGNSFQVDIKLENINLIDGDFDISVEEGSRVVGNNIISDAPFLLFSRNSQMQFTNCKFKIGANDEITNRILFPYNVSFEKCEFYATRKITEKKYSFFSVADVWWQHPSYEKQNNQLLVYKDCYFRVDSNIKSGDKTYAIYLREDSKTNNNQLIIDGGFISPDFDAAIASETQGIVEKNLTNPDYLVISSSGENS